jgi:ubiquinone/menaquinone biosynthesis C-methylase UbiE
MRWTTSKAVDYQRLYDRMAPLYAPAMRLLPVWLDYARQAIPYLPALGAILEIGPGPGVLLQQIAQTHPMTVGVDLSSGMLWQAQRRLRQHHLAARFVQASALQLPFVSDSFDGVALTFVFSAIPNGMGALREIRRVLRPNGAVALVDACLPENDNRVARELGRAWELFGDTLRDESTLMLEAGLDVVERREFGAFNSIRLTVGRKR